jgi:nucleotide-binding universal stress UspA family protein
MSSLKRILVGADGSDTGARAVLFAIERALLHKATVSVGYAPNRTSVAIAMSNPYGYVDPTPMLDAIDDDADAILETCMSTAIAYGVSATSMKLEGPPAHAIAERAKETGADLVVVGTHGRRGIQRTLIGSVAEGVIRSCTPPVFVVPQSGSPSVSALKRALVCIDGSPASKMALAFAARIAEVEKTWLTLCTVAEPEEMEERAAETLANACRVVPDTTASVDSQLLHGDAVTEISLLAEKTSADCIFVGTHGRAGIPRMILGSVASGLLQLSRVPICTTRYR